MVSTRSLRLLHPLSPRGAQRMLHSGLTGNYTSVKRLGEPEIWSCPSLEQYGRLCGSKPVHCDVTSLHSEDNVGACTMTTLSVPLGSVPHANADGFIDAIFARRETLRCRSVGACLIARRTLCRSMLRATNGEKGEGNHRAPCRNQWRGTVRCCGPVLWSCQCLWWAVWTGARVGGESTRTCISR